MCLACVESVLALSVTSLFNSIHLLSQVPVLTLLVNQPLQLLIGLSWVPICCRGESAEYSRALSDLNNWFVSSYVAEAVLKNLAFGPWAYIKDNW